MIKIENLTKCYEGLPVIENLTLSINKGEKACFFAPSGTGKTTLMQLIAGFIGPDSGSITFPYSSRMSYLFQDDRLLPWYTAEKNVDIVNKSNYPTSYFFKHLSLTGSEKKMVNELSGGMKRRVALARALAYGGDIFILDEPLKGLDEAMRQKTLSFLKTDLKDKTVLFITHDLAEAKLFSTKIYEFSARPLCEKTMSILDLL